MYLCSTVRNFRKGALEKGYLHKMIRNCLSNSRPSCNNFAHPSSDVRNEIPAISLKFGAQFATSLRNAPFTNAPFSGFLTLFRARQRSGEGVVRRNGCPKRCFWRVRFFSAPLRFLSYNTWKLLKTLGEQRRNGLSKNTLLDNRFSARPLRCWRAPNCVLCLICSVVYQTSDWATSFCVRGFVEW